MDTPNDQGNASDDWNNMDYADMANYSDTSALDPIADVWGDTDHLIASNSYLVTSDIIFDD